MTVGQPAAHSDPHRLSLIERNRILDQAIDSCAHPKIDLLAPRPNPLVLGYYQRVDPKITHKAKIRIDRSTASAELVWGKTFSSPIVFVLCAVISFFSCGFFLPIWFYMTLRPNRYAQSIFIDEKGFQDSGLAPIPQGQRVVSVLVAIGIVLWIIWMINQFHSA
jgi:hypothetical protein